MAPRKRCNIEPKITTKHQYLNNDILSLIFPFLDDDTLIFKASLVSTQWFHMINQTSIVWSSRIIDFQSLKIQKYLFFSDDEICLNITHLSAFCKLHWMKEDFVNTIDIKLSKLSKDDIAVYSKKFASIGSEQVVEEVNKPWLIIPNSCCKLQTFICEFNYPTFKYIINLLKSNKDTLKHLELTGDYEFQRVQTFLGNSIVTREDFEDFKADNVVLLSHLESLIIKENDFLCLYHILAPNLISFSYCIFEAEKNLNHNSEVKISHEVYGRYPKLKSLKYFMESSVFAITGDPFRTDKLQVALLQSCIDNLESFSFKANKRSSNDLFPILSHCSCLERLEVLEFAPGSRSIFFNALKLHRLKFKELRILKWQELLDDHLSLYSSIESAAIIVKFNCDSIRTLTIHPANLFVASKLFPNVERLSLYAVEESYDPTTKYFKRQFVGPNRHSFHFVGLDRFKNLVELEYNDNFFLGFQAYVYLENLLDHVRILKLTMPTVICPHLILACPNAKITFKFRLVKEKLQLLQHSSTEGVIGDEIFTSWMKNQMVDCIQNDYIIVGKHWKMSEPQKLEWIHQVNSSQLHFES